MNRIRNTSAFFRKLSLNAEKNWHQNSGAKRRVSSKDEDMAVPVFDRARAARMLTATSSGLPTAAKGLKDDNWAKGQSAAKRDNRPDL